MKAVVIKGCCQADDLRVSDLPVPKVCPGWVLVKVHAAGLNHSEAVLRMYEADEAYINTPIVPGIECAGEVVDPSDSSLRVGDRVVALMGGMGRSFNGSYAEYALLPQSHVFKVNSDLPWVELAAVPETYFTAYGSLSQCLLLSAGDVLLVRGATSTVGQAAIQLARAMGASVLAACRHAQSFERLRALGANDCVADDEHLARQSLPMQPNKVLELVGPRTLADSMLSVSRPGYVCNTGILGNVFTLEHFDPIKEIPNGVFLSGFFSNYPTQRVIDEIFALLHAHGLHPLYSRVFRLDQIAEAHRLLEHGGAGGKMVLTMD